MNEKAEDKVDVSYYNVFYTVAYSHLLRPMKRSLYWPKIDLSDILPPKARRMPDIRKKHRRREQGEDGAGSKLSKKGVLMRCSQCLKAGDNKGTCKVTAEEITDIQKTAAEAKKAQSEASRAHATQNSYTAEGKKGNKSKKETYMASQLMENHISREVGADKLRPRNVEVLLHHLHCLHLV
ncbi:hypothetical protein POM88_013036 [Heracleum sosnowskyi]|uniref:Uncharacterized protein n=1 Tax=Heracleum sosnowskyi TaxID=360622 RepID=A0AAD8IXU4_9APIA|nr:hypothetical protein POM88_013036 [Heracleum sosnowskyi]